MIYIDMFAIGVVCWLLATITAGGAGLIFLSLAAFLIPHEDAVIILAATGTVAGLYRIYIYRDALHVQILKYLIPGTVIGAVCGALLFTQIVDMGYTDLLRKMLGVLLLLSGSYGLLRLTLFHVKPRYGHFFWGGLLTSFISGLVGVSGALINSLFQRFSLTANQIIATKSCNMFLLQLLKTIIFIWMIVVQKNTYHGDMALSEMGAMAVWTTLGAALGVYGGKALTDKIKVALFNKVLNIMMVIYGIVLLWPAG